jgi:hypothetical protein
MPVPPDEVVTNVVALGVMPSVDPGTLVIERDIVPNITTNTGYINSVNCIIRT